ncbi:MAG: hypothetical protein KJZ83_08415 [Burkholderiaceae bacterium]|nr:hypothetical protein [Burkholderiaceae bacterium]
MVFLANDEVLSEILHEVGQRLTESGFQIVYGDAPPRECDAPWVPPELERADVAMFTMRSQCTEAMLRGATRLRGIVYPTIGTDSLDLEAADALGIIVGHGAMPENFIGIAEATVMLILMQLYDPLASSNVLHGRRMRPRPDANSVWARLLCGRTVGIVGFGRIGRAVADRLAHWHVRLLACDPHALDLGRPSDVTLVDFDTLMGASDVVVISVALTPQTRDIVDARALSLMKPESHLINISRGEAVDEQALAVALREHRIGGAALDVTRVEPLPLDSELRTLDNCFLTPHMIGQTKDVFRVIAPTAVENIVRILGNEIPRYCKNPQARVKWIERLQMLGISTPNGGIE